MTNSRFPVDPRGEIQALALYYTSWCPFCMRVLRAVDALKLRQTIALRDVDADEASDDELRAARGRGTVPVLRIQTAEGEHWMPESADIVSFLQERFDN